MNGSGSSEDDAEDRVFYRPSLPPSLPVVSETIDGLLSVSAKQRVFIANHADKLRLELDEELASSSTATLAFANGADFDSFDDDALVGGMSPPEGEWRLNGFSLSDTAVLDLVRASPDLLSNLEYAAFTESGLLARISKFFRFGRSAKKEERNALNIADDLAYVLTPAEVVEISGHLLSLVSHALSSQSPKIGKPLVREVAFELTNSRHRGHTHSMYLLALVRHERQNAASNRKANTLHIGLSLYLHTPNLLGGSTGVAVNVSGNGDVDDMPTADVDAGELQRVLAKKGVFCSRSGSDFVIRQDLAVTSERASRVAVVATERLVEASNDSLTAFFEKESSQFASERAMERKRLEEELREAKREAAEAEKMAELREAREELRRENASRIQEGRRQLVGGRPIDDASDASDWW